MTTWLAALSVVELVVTLALAAGRARFPRRQFLPLAGLVPGGSAPDSNSPESAQGNSAPPDARVVAVVPARDEEALIALTVESLLRQVPALEWIVVVDDGSRDQTAERARHAAGEDTRVCVVPAPPRPAGWSGKVWALECGVRRARELDPGAGWLLACDADIRLHAGALGGLLATARAGGYSLVSVMARLRALGGWERLLVPPFVFFFHLLYPFAAVSKAGSGVAAAAGGCVLLATTALRRAGGYAALRGALIDDVSLARAVKRAGGALWLGFDAGVESARPYPRLRDLWQMVQRNAFVQLRFRWDLLALVLLALVLVFVAPPLIALATGVHLAAGTGARAAASVIGLAAASAVWLLQSLLLWPFARHLRVPAWYAATLPLAALLFAAMTVSAAWAHTRGRSSAWKGRIYRPEGEN